MDKLVIQGGQRLSGSVEIGSSKNAVLPLLAASLLIDKGEVVISDVPELADIDTMLKLLEILGAKIHRDKKDRKVSINSENLNNFEAPYDLVRKMRASFLVLGPLLARLGKAKVSLPGGCVLGARPVDQHVKGFKAMGVSLTEDAGYIIGESNGMGGATVCFDRPTHTGTENLITGAVLASGKTTLINASCDPEVTDLAEFLNKRGAKISGAGTSVVEITGVKKLRAGPYSAIPDRLEAGTYMMAAAVTGGYLELKNVIPDHLSIVNDKLKEMGCEIQINGRALKLKGPKKLKHTEVITHPYPGFPTDLQPPIMSLCTLASGTSRLKETVFDNRYTHVMELIRLGAKIRIDRDEAIIDGVNQLTGAQVMASDIRGGAGLITACLAAQGTSEVLRVYHVDRGYENIEQKLSQLGAKISRVSA
ncbi:MAG: UDP-N-acetylglucosamine 1-carboxyvinyltransferase [candidate division Zixibacteria bacterium]|nr:UDP-N-acetylglucosamine 1-carboxyvinyltransferase [candidate division Zixibacteria bacterium]